MKIAATCCLGLLMILASTARAQPVVPPPSLPCPAPPAKAVIDWAQFRFAPCHTGFNPYELVLSPDTVGSLDLRWSYQTGDMVNSSPAVANGVVYVGSDDGNLYALRASTGEVIWKYASGEPVDSSPAVANGVVYMGSDDGNL